MVGRINGVHTERLRYGAFHSKGVLSWYYQTTSVLYGFDPAQPQPVQKVNFLTFSTSF